MLKYSEALRNALMVTGSLKSLIDGSEIRFYSGSAPSSPAEAISGTKLVTIKVGTDGVTFEAEATGGTLVKNLSEVWSGTAAAAGTATHFRLVATADADGASPTAYRIQGSVGIAGADINVTNPTLAIGASQTLDYFYLTMPES